MSKKKTRHTQKDTSTHHSASGDITVVLTVYNEEENIVPCIRNAQKLADTIVVVDTESTDSTVEQAKKQGLKVHTYPYKKYVEPSRNFAISKVKTSWFFILDADERFTDELIKEVHETISSTDKTHFKVQRNNIFAGRWHLQHGGWDSDEIIRLINTDAFINWPEHIHSTPEIEGDMGMLQKPLLHHFHPSLENMVAKTALYENMEAQLLYEAQRKTGVLIFVRKFLGELYRRLFKWKGYKDGVPGLIESIYQAYSKTTTYLFLYEKYESNR